MRTYLSSLLTVLTLVFPNLASSEVLGSPSTEQQFTPSHSQAIDRRMDQLHGLKVAAEGPNCWNAVLSAVGLATAPRYVSKPEMWHWLQSRYCRQLGNDELPQRGDVGSIFWKQWGNYHAYVYFDGGTVFTKDGPSPEESYNYQSYLGQFKPEYRAEANRCKNLTLNQSLARRDCDLKTVYHRCSPLPPDFYQRHESLRGLEEQVTQAEMVIQKWLTKPKFDMISQVESAAKVLARALTDLRQRRYSGELEFARQSLEHRVIGLFMSGSYNTFSDDVRAAEAFADQIQTSERSHVPSTPPLK